MLKVATAVHGTDTREFVHIIPELTIPVGPQPKRVFSGRLKNSAKAPRLQVKIEVSGNLDYGVICHKTGGIEIGEPLAAFRPHLPEEHSC
jgi:hypothetical protein